MIAFFLDTVSRAQFAAEVLCLEERAADGPFEVFRSPLDTRAVAFCVEQGADAAYSAARIAARRGATMLLPITSATVRELAAKDRGVDPGMILPVGPVWDLESLTPLMHMLPDSAREIPLPLEEHLPAKPLLGPAGDAPACGTYHQPIRNRHLRRALEESRGILLLDRQMAGYAAAAQDTGVELRGACLVTLLLGKTGWVADTPLETEKRFEQQMAALAEKFTLRC